VLTIPIASSGNDGARRGRLRLYSRFISEGMTEDELRLSGASNKAKADAIKCLKMESGMITK
jgi:hypothetical protein